MWKYLGNRYIDGNLLEEHLHTVVNGVIVQLKSNRSGNLLEERLHTVVNDKIVQ